MICNGCTAKKKGTLVGVWTDRAPPTTTRSTQMQVQHVPRVTSGQSDNSVAHTLPAENLLADTGRLLRRPAMLRRP